MPSRQLGRQPLPGSGGIQAHASASTPYRASFPSSPTVSGSYSPELRNGLSLCNQRTERTVNAGAQRCKTQTRTRRSRSSRVSNKAGDLPGRSSWFSVRSVRSQRRDLRTKSAPPLRVVTGRLKNIKFTPALSTSTHEVSQNVVTISLIRAEDYKDRAPTADATPRSIAPGLVFPVLASAGTCLPRATGCPRSDPVYFSVAASRAAVHPAVSVARPCCSA